MDLYEFEQKIKAYIKQDGRSQAAVARKLGYSRDTFNKWVRCVNRMPDTIIYEFCDLLGLDERQRVELLELVGYAVPPRSDAESREAVSPNRPLQRPPQAEYFMDRREALAQLLDELQPGKVVTLCGPGGIGKTALAAKAVWTLAPGDTPPEQFPDGILFHSFYNQPQVDLALEAFARSFGEEPQPTPAIAAQRALAGRQALLILDGAEDADDLDKILAIRDQCAVLVTSRQHKDAVAQWQDMQPLPEDDAVALLQAWAGKWTEDEESTRQICRMVGELPLAVRLVGRCLAEQGWNAAEYLDWLRETPLVALDQGQRRQESVPLLLERSLKQVSEQARRVLGIVGLLALAPFDRKTITISLELPSSSQTMKALGELVNYGLVLSDGENYEVAHALIHTFAHEKLLPNTAVVTRLVEYYIHILQQEQENSVALNASLLHVLVLLRICIEREVWSMVSELANRVDRHLDLQGHWTDRIEVNKMALYAAQAIQNRNSEAQSLSNLGDTYHALGEYKRATDNYHQGLEIADAIGDLHNKNRLLGGLANVYHSSGEYQQALDHYQQALEVAQTIGDQENTSRHLGGLGTAFYYQGDYENSLKHYQQAISIAQDVGNKRYEGIFFGGSGSVHHALGNYQQAIDNYQQALEISTTTGDRRSVANWSGNLGIVYLALGDSKGAIEYYQKALNISKSIGDRQREGFWLGKLGHVYAFYLMQYEEATEYHVWALEIAQTIGDRRTESILLNSLGRIHKLRGENDSALGCYNKALEISRILGAHEQTCRCLIELGQNYSEDLGEYEKSIDHFQQALHIAKNIGSPALESSSLGNLAGPYSVLGEYEKALNYYQQAKDIAKDIGSRETEGVWQGNIGRMYMALGEHEKGIHCYEQALAIAQKLGIRRSQGVWLGFIGMAYNRLNQTETAITYLKQALDIAQDIGHRRFESEHLGELGIAYTELKQYQLAMRYVEQGLQIARDIKDPYREAQRLSELGIIYQNLKQLGHAKKHWEQSLRIFEEIKSPSAANDVRELLRGVDKPEPSDQAP